MRIGAVSYLNTRPLVYGLADLAPQHELVFDLPSRLADRLAAGELDVALIPSIEYFQNPEYTIVSDACIGCRGPVRSVKLLCRVAPERIRTLALDEGSRTSVALVRILLRERFGLEPQLVPFPINAAPESISADALLMIGDRAMHPPLGEYVAEWDLGDHWCRWAELPFVFAMWVAGPGVRSQASGARGQESGKRSEGQRSADELSDLGSTLSQARDLGVQHLGKIACEEHARYGLNYDDCLTYLRDHLHFYLGPRERAGLALFRQHAQHRGLIAPSALTRPGPASRQRPVAIADSGSKFASG